jgi:hypothetical protein
MAHASRAAAALCLAAALAAGCGLAAAAGTPLIAPAFQFGLPNTTSNWTATAPVTWALLDRSNSRRIVGAVPGYAEVWITDTNLELLAGQRGGLFHVRALRNSCTDAADAGCVATALWLVLSDVQMAGLGFAVAVAVTLCAFGVVRRLQPPPETPEERHRRMVGLGIVQDYYGTFEGADGGAGEGTAMLDRKPRKPPPRRAFGAAGDTL